MENTDRRPVRGQANRRGSGTGFGSSSISRLLLFFLSVIIGLVVVGAGGEQTAQAESTEQQQAVIAVVVPLSGSLAALGEQLVESATFAGEATGVPVEAVDAGDSVAETHRRIEELAGRPDVGAIIGPVRRNRARSVARLADEHQIPIVAFSPVTGVEHTGDWIVRVRPGPEEQARSLVRYLVDELGMEHFGIVGPRNDYADALIRSIVESINDRGSRVEALARYDEETTDFTRPLEVLTGRRVYVGDRSSVGGQRVGPHQTVTVDGAVERDFEVLIIADHHDTVARLLPFLPRAGMATGAVDEGRSVLVAGPSSWRGDGLQRAGKHGEGNIFVDTFGGRADGGEAVDFVRRFEARTDRRPTTVEAEMYDVFAMLATAFEPGRAVDEVRLAVRNWSKPDQTHEGVTGTWRFDRSGAPVRQMVPYQVGDGGGWVRVRGGDR